MAPRENNETARQPAAVIFLSHVLHESVLTRFKRLAAETLPSDDTYFAYDATNAGVAELRKARHTAGDRLRTFTEDEVIDTDRRGSATDQRTSSTGSQLYHNLASLYTHLSRLVPGYSRYWFIEYDVAYTGPWSRVFHTFKSSTADVLGTTLQPYDHNKHWHWWDSFRPGPDLNRSEWVRGFFPVVRLSEDILEALDGAHRDGWSGHPEAVIPTLARQQGLTLEDLGGNGPYVRAGNTDRLYTNTPETGTLAPGTFIYRPARPRPGIRPGKLWHPVKPDSNLLLAYARLLKRRFYQL